jgi:hypothetical protein
MNQMGRCALSAYNVNFLPCSVTTQHRNVKVFSKLLPGWSDLLVVGRCFFNCRQYTTGTDSVIGLVTRQRA